ncbi:MAG TPA: sialidase family protein, partial [Phycisphaerae bacterium]|nr:sialidase family protein [Phycisphaerae bacterium]
MTRAIASYAAACIGFAAIAGVAGCSEARRAHGYGGKVIIEQSEVFVSGREGYHTFRIPSLIVTRGGTILAFCEGRRNSRSDTGDIDIVLKRSTDNGRTWGPMQLVADHGPDTIGNPCPVVDRETDTIWLLLTGNPGRDNEKAIKDRTASGTRTVWVSRSTDEGATWTTPVDITATTKRADWTWYATGPGCGIQLASGRLVIPCDHNVEGTKMTRRSHVIYSDDHGATWQIGGVALEDVNECQVVERVDGSLMLNMRNYARGPGVSNRRAVAISRDGGLTWSALRYDTALIEPICQASFIRFTGGPAPRNPERERRASAKNRLLFANPASTKREKFTVRISYDEGETWPVAKELHAGPTAYSALAVLPDMTIGCLYERGEKDPYEKLTFARFSVEWL